MPTPKCANLNRPLAHPEYFHQQLSSYLSPHTLDEEIQRSLNQLSRWPWEADDRPINQKWQNFYRKRLHKEDLKEKTTCQNAHNYFLNVFLPQYFPQTSEDELTPSIITKYNELVINHAKPNLINALSKYCMKDHRKYLSPSTIQKILDNHQALLVQHKPSHLARSVVFSKTEPWTEEDDAELCKAVCSRIFTFQTPREVIARHLADDATTWPWTSQLPWSDIKQTYFSTKGCSTRGLERRFVSYLIPHTILKQPDTLPPEFTSWIMSYVSIHGRKWSQASRDFFLLKGFYISSDVLKRTYETTIKTQNQDLINALYDHSTSPDLTLYELDAFLKEHEKVLGEILDHSI